MAYQQRLGWGEAPEFPNATPKLVVDPRWTPKQLSFALLAANRNRLLSAALLLIVFNISMMLLPTVIGKVVDVVITPAAQGIAIEELSTPIIVWFGAVVVLYLLANLGFRFGSRIGWLGVQRGHYELAQAVIARVLEPRGFAGTKRAPGQLLSIATGDTQRACQVLYILVYPPGEAVALIVALISLSVVNLWLGLGALLGLPLVLFLLHRIAAPLRARSMKEQASLADTAGSAADLVSGYRVLRGLHAEEAALGSFRGMSRKALNATLSARNARAVFDGVSTSGAQLFGVLLTIAALLMAFQGVISVGELVAVTGIAVIMAGPLDQLVSTLGAMWAMSQASAQRILDLLNAPHHPAALGKGDVDPTATLHFDELNIQGTVLDATIVPGELSVIDIPQAAGTELAQILTLSQEVSKGAVRLGSAEINSLDPGQFRAHIAVLPHRPGILAGTVASNVHRDTACAQAALRVANLDPRELPNGIATLVHDGGSELSGGQRQRIALARAIAAQSKILVLIDPTTSVDSVTEARIAKDLRNHRHGLTTIVITASPAFRAIAENVINAKEQP